MNRFLALSMTAMLSVAVMVDLPVSANAQGFQQNPLTMAGIGDVAGAQDGVIEVRARKRRSRRTSRRRRNNAAGVIIGSAIIGAIIAEQNRRRYRREGRRVYRGDAHENWCYRRFRSYRAWDNSYQPYRGGRRQCISPYY